MKYQLSLAAEADIQDIYRYSFDQFGERRADKYVMGLHEEFGHISGFPEIGKSLSRKGFEHIRRYDHISHIVIYTQIEDSIKILRVLHISMDIDSQLKPDENNE